MTIFPSATAASDQSGARPNLSTYLSQQILRMIREQDLKPGDRLPAARDLAARFSVATPTIREALRQLQATGIVDIRHGSGIYVRRDSDRLLLANPAYGELETRTIMQVLEARLLIEPHLSELAAQSATDEQVRELEALLVQAENTLNHPDSRYLDANYELHTAIARASGNEVLTHVVQTLLEMYSSELNLVDPESSFAEIRARDHARHKVVVSAIAAGDGKTAYQAMAGHIESARETVESRITP